MIHRFIFAVLASVLAVSCATHSPTGTVPGARTKVFAISCTDRHHEKRQGPRVRYVASWDEKQNRPVYGEENELGTAATDFHNAIRTELRTDKRRRSLLLYVHGYNNTETVAAQTALMLANETMKGSAVPVYYLWPCQARLLGYSNDRNRIDDSAFHLARFMLEFAKENQASGDEVPVDIVGHSMGSEIVLKALWAMQSIASSTNTSPLKIRRLLLAAPDVENAKFEFLVPSALRAVSEGMTVYLNRYDPALRISILANDKYQRAGCPTIAAKGATDEQSVWFRVCHDSDRDLNKLPRSLRDKLSIVDVSSPDLKGTTKGHGYFRCVDRVKLDMQHFLHDGLISPQSRGLKQTTRQVRYWGYTPDNDVALVDQPCTWWSLP